MGVVADPSLMPVVATPPVGSRTVLEPLVGSGAGRGQT